MPPKRARRKPKEGLRQKNRTTAGYQAAEAKQQEFGQQADIDANEPERLNEARNEAWNPLQTRYDAELLDATMRTFGRQPAYIKRRTQTRHDGKAQQAQVGGDYYPLHQKFHNKTDDEQANRGISFLIHITLCGRIPIKLLPKSKYISNSNARSSNEVHGCPAPLFFILYFCWKSHTMGWFMVVWLRKCNPENDPLTFSQITKHCISQMRNQQGKYRFLAQIW